MVPNLSNGNTPRETVDVLWPTSSYHSPAIPRAADGIPTTLINPASLLGRKTPDCIEELEFRTPLTKQGKDVGDVPVFSGLLPVPGLEDYGKNERSRDPFSHSSGVAASWILVIVFTRRHIYTV